MTDAPQNPDTQSKTQIHRSDSLDRLLRIEPMQDTASLDRQFDILFADVTVAGLDFLELYRTCMARTGTEVQSWKSLRRALRAQWLGKYFDSVRDLDGEVAECGVLRGFSARVMCTLAAARRPGYRGEGLHLIDSFEGLSPPTQEDATERHEAPDGTVRYQSHHRPGDMAVPEEDVRAALEDYPEIATYKGWIPEVFGRLPEKRWRFVHIDLDLFGPTIESMAYFYPRLVSGGVMINDDFDSPLFPGGGEAWIEYCQTMGVKFTALDSGQAVIVKP